MKGLFICAKGWTIVLYGLYGELHWSNNMWTRQGFSPVTQTICCQYCREITPDAMLHAHAYESCLSLHNTMWIQYFYVDLQP